jgi:hypothetical protein
MKLKMLNGAPLSEHLDFSEASLLATEKCNAFNILTEMTVTAEESTPALKWRSLSTKNTRLRTGWSQPYLPGSTQRSDISLSIPNVQRSSPLPQDDTTNPDYTMASFEDPSIAVDDFLEHSLAFHDTLLSSQVLQDDANHTTLDSSSFPTTSFGTTISDFSSPSKLVNEHTLILQVSSKMTITPLNSLPSAQYLRSIYPQTPTPNFLCALTANPEQREVFVRKGGYKMNLWEVTVADDTLSNLKITFWLRPPRESNNEQIHAQNLLLQTLQSIKVGDILLLRNIALTSFRETVFGQSLNPAITRARTGIDVLMRSSGISVGQLGSLPAPVVEAFMRVKKWAKAHIVSDNAGAKKRKGSATKQDKTTKRTFGNHDFDNSMPPDTMESV